MKRYTLIPALAAVFVAGCGHKDEIVVNGADGSQATISKGPGGTTTFEGAGKDGSKVTETVSDKGGATINATDKNGNKATATMGANGMSGSDSKGDSYNMGAGTVSEADLAVPFYPGSEESKDVGMSMVSQDPKNKVAISYRSTKDDPSKVVEFYKDKIPGGKTASMAAGGGTMASISGKLASGATISVTATNDGKKDTVVMVSSTIPKS